MSGKNIMDIHKMIEDTFERCGFTVEEIQPTDTSVGILSGWILFSYLEGDHQLKTKVYRNLDFEDFVYGKLPEEEEEMTSYIMEYSTPAGDDGEEIIESRNTY